MSPERAASTLERCVQQQRGLMGRSCALQMRRDGGAVAVPPGATSAHTTHLIMPQHANSLGITFGGQVSPSHSPPSTQLRGPGFPAQHPASGGSGVPLRWNDADVEHGTRVWCLPSAFSLGRNHNPICHVSPALHLK